MDTYTCKLSSKVDRNPNLCNALKTLSGPLDLLITFPKRERNVATLSSLKWLASLTLSVFSESFKPA